MNTGTREMWMFSLILLCCSTRAVFSSSCDKDRLMKCLKKVHTLMDSQWDIVSVNSDKLKEYCADLKDDAECLKNLPDDCEKKYKEVNILKPSIKKFKARFCKDDASEKKLFKQKIECLVDKKVNHNVCNHAKGSKSSAEVSDQKYCKDELAFLKCYEEKTEKACDKDGRKLWEYLQEPKLDLIRGFCNSSGAMATNVATVLLLAILAVMRTLFW